MLDQTMNESYVSDSRLIVPFYLDYRYEKKHHILFSTENWQEDVRRPRYITKYMQEIYSGGTGGICTFYKLKPEKWTDFGLPVGKNDQTPAIIRMESRIIKDSPGQYEFSLTDITAAYFSTGIGFLFLDIKHIAEEALDCITDKCFALACIFTNEHDNSGKESRVAFYREGQDESREYFSLKNVIYQILKTDQLKEKIKIFPTNTRRKPCVYHNILKKEADPADEKYMKSLAKEISSSAVASDEDTDIVREFAPTRHTIWHICSMGVVSLIYDDEQNHDFLFINHSRNVKSDYFLIYLFVLHERELLLKYNYDAVRNWNNPPKLMAMKEELVKFNLWFSYNTVSVEMSYQSFYEHLYEAMKLEKLETDIQDVVVKVNEHVSAVRDRKINGILTAVALLAVVSVFTDGLSLVDRLYGEPLKAGHIAILLFIFVTIGCGIYSFFRRKR